MGIKSGPVNDKGVHVGQMIMCPACNCGHLFPQDRWKFNGDQEKPSFTPSMKITTGPVSKRKFPVLRGSRKKPEWGVDTIDWSLLEPNEVQAVRNHGQDLKTLASRGGLSPREALAVIKGLGWTAMKDAYPEDDSGEEELKDIVRAWWEAQPNSVCHSVVTDGKIAFCSDCTHEMAGKTVDLPDW